MQGFKSSTWPALCAGLLLLAGCTTAPRNALDSLPLPDPMVDIGAQPEYHLGPGDLLHVQVFEIDGLERDVRVDNNGRVTLPLIGTVQAGGKTLDELQADVTQRYGSRYLQNPQVSILIQQFTGKSVTVSGAVDNPGVYPIAGSRMTLQAAVATAKGVSPIASQRNIIVFRTVGGQRQLARFDLVDIQHGEAEDPAIYGGDTIVVYRSGARVVLRTLIELTPIVNVFRVYR